MASVRKEILIDAGPEDVWSAVRDFGAVHRRLVPGFVVDARLDGDARVVTFANGTVARELLVDLDDEARRLVYAVVGGQVTQHSASVQVDADGEGRSRLVWITDVLPHALAEYISAQVEQAAGVMKQTLERRTASFLDALHAGGPAADRTGNMDLYGRLVGSWELDVTEFQDDGSTRRRPGEWHFGWVLEGRAIQDVWIVPPRGATRQGDAAANSNYYGSTLRVYDPRIDAWHIRWTDPVAQAYLSQIGRKQGDDIVQEGKDAAGNLRRWSFSEITPNSFRWRGEVSVDGGATWRLLTDFSARRAGST